jgi:hypothetical protein
VAVWTSSATPGPFPWSNATGLPIAAALSLHSVSAARGETTDRVRRCANTVSEGGTREAMAVIPPWRRPDVSDRPQRPCQLYANRDLRITDWHSVIFSAPDF